MQINKIQFVDLLTKVNVFSVLEEKVEIVRVRDWYTGDKEVKEFDCDLCYNQLIEFSINGKGWIFKDRHIVERKSKEFEEQLEIRFYTRILFDLIRGGFKSLIQ